MKVLITGSEGGVGQAVGKELRSAGHLVFGFDRVASDAWTGHTVGDLGDRRSVRNAIEGMDAVIHLAATPDEADFIDELIEPNVRGLYHVCDAARHLGVSKLVLASSVQVVSGHDWSSLVGLSDGPRVINHYALTKLWAENLGEMYARVYNMSIVAARLGWLPRAHYHAEELLASPVGTDVYLSHTDAGRFFRACIEADLAPPRFEILFATSKSGGKTRIDLSRTTEVTGYVPQDTWPEGQPFIT